MIGEAGNRDFTKGFSYQKNDFASAMVHMRGGCILSVSELL